MSWPKYLKSVVPAAVTLVLALVLVPTAFPQGQFHVREASEGTAAIQFASGADWTVFSADPGSTPFLRTPSLLGPAQRVCMSAIAPPTCAPGATIYHSPFYGWTADLSSISGASWIWRPGIDGSSMPADLADYFFSRTLILAGRPTGGILYVSADDFAAVRVNESLVGTIGSIVDPSLAGTHTYLTAFDIGPFLHPGRNVITVEAQNGPAYFSGLCDPCSYALNPAGVAFGGSLRYTPAAPHEQLGGLNLDGFCQSLGYEGVAQTKPRFAVGAAIANWRCVSGEALHPFSMEQACKWEYGIQAVQAHFLDRDDAYSWKCFAVSR